MLPTNDAVTSAFNQLHAAAVDLQEKRGRCLGANLKLELKRRSSGMFSEEQLGFGRFGDFLRAAESAGFVRLQSTPGGDLQVLPYPRPLAQPQSRILSGESSIPPRTVQDLFTLMRSGLQASSSTEQTAEWRVPVLSPAVRIRQDLWNAFNSVHDVWVYDRSQDLAVRKAVAERSGLESDSLVSIPAGRALLVNWILAFAEGQPSDRKERVHAMIDEPAAPLNFLQAAKNDKSLQRAWHRFHVQKALDAIQRWCVEMNVRPNGIIRSTRAQMERAYTNTQEPPSPVAKTEPAWLGREQHIKDKRVQLVEELLERLFTLRGLLAVEDRRP